MDNCIDKLSINIGREILDIVPGRVSTEVSARLSFNTAATVTKARKLIALYNEAGIPNDRVLIKIASTWEGIRAAETLEKEGIQCNLTLLFSFEQAVACADAGVFLISPFVGRIFDWYCKSEGVDRFSPKDDPGVKSVTSIFEYYKQQGVETVVMGASFRNTDQIEQLAGCDRLTISPDLLAKLDDDYGHLDIKLSEDSDHRDISLSRTARNTPTLEEDEFRWLSNENAMATEKLAEGIRNFYADQRKLEALVNEYGP